MSGSSSVLAWSSALEEFALFRTLSSEQRLKVLSALVRQDLVRGQLLVAQGGPSDSFFLVLHGALAVRKTGYSEPIAELRAGELVGEIGFFANGPRTADVIAIRDTSVLALTRPAYQKLVEEAPAIVEALLAALARRFAKETARIAPFPSSPKARTVALIDGGVQPLPAAFDRRMRDGLAATQAEIIDAARLQAMFPGRALDAHEVTEWLNRLEHTAPLVVYIGGGEASPWARKAIRQADMVVFACRGEAPAAALTEIEAFACEVHAVSARRLVRVHDHRSGEVSGTAAWLARLPAFMHHHVALEDQIDIDSLVRFLCGRAVGFVAAGGGSFGTAHVGIYKAFRERGVMFDIFVGTSVGSAMVAGFAKNLEAEHLERGTHEIFVKSRSFRRPTWPRYSLLDHKAFDRALAHQYGPDCRIEDCWRPFAAVATNLSTHNLELIRTGPGLAGGARIERDPRAVAAVLHAGGGDAGRRMSDRQRAADVDAPAQERSQSGGAFRRAGGGDVRCRLCGAAGTVRTDRRHADAVPQEVAARGAERGERAVAKPRGASALRYAAGRAVRHGNAPAASGRGRRDGFRSSHGNL
jgi:NTE family protein